ncbi:hypothetical protein BT93_G0352 [Corymbia citriodora subsp. variegata]|nr:hypothetical protein BT93_G0352 [Corymbia citriodora subsp. variegata]
MAAVIIPNNLPVGYRFHPTDEEFIDHYLKNRVRGFVDRPCIIPDVDICGWDPWQLPQKFQGESIIRLDDKVQEWWFFCPQTPQQAKRSTPSGFWKKTGNDRNVKARDANRVIGSKKTLVFHKGRGSRGVKTNWVIHEYHLPPKDLNRTYVLCRLKHKRDEKADNSTAELEQGANNLTGLDSDLRQPDHEDSFRMDWIEDTLNSVPSFQPENRVQFSSPIIQQMFQPESPVQISSSNIRQMFQPESPVQISSSNIRQMFQPESPVQISSSNIRQMFQPENPVQFSSSNIRQMFQPENPVQLSSPNIRQMFQPENPVQILQPENRAQFSSPNILQMFQPVQRSQNNIPPININQFLNIESPSFMDLSLDNDLTEESIPWESLFRTSEDDEAVGDVQISDYFDADFFAGDQMQTQCGQASGSQEEHPFIMKNRRTRTFDSFHGFVPLEEKKGMVENKFNGSCVTSEKPMPRPASANYYSKDEEKRFENFKQETAAKNNKPECASLDETAARAKYPKMPESRRIYIKEEPRFEKVKKQEVASRNIKPERVSLDESAAKAKVLENREHGSATDSPKKTNSKETEHAREKSNSATALTRPTTESTNCSTNFPSPNLVNVIFGFFLLFAITCQVLNL